MRKQIGIKPLLAGLFVASVLYSGVMVSIGKSQLAFWPFKKSWYMFSFESPWHRELEMTAADSKGKEVVISLRDWFQAPASETTSRIEEIPRNVNTLRRFAAYVCNRAKREKKFEGIKSVSIRDIYWPRRSPLSVQDEKLRSGSARRWVENYPCR